MGGEFGDGRRQQDIGAASLQRHDLRIHGCIGGLIVSAVATIIFVRLVAESFAQADEVVLAEIVVLVEHRDLGVRHVLEDVASVDTRLDAVARLKAHCPG